MMLGVMPDVMVRGVMHDAALRGVMHDAVRDVMHDATVPGVMHDAAVRGVNFCLIAIGVRGSLIMAPAGDVHLLHHLHLIPEALASPPALDCRGTVSPPAPDLLGTCCMYLIHEAPPVPDDLRHLLHRLHLIPEAPAASTAPETCGSACT